MLLNDNNVYVGTILHKRELESVVDLLEFHERRNDLDTEQKNAYRVLKNFYLKIEGENNIQLKSYIDR